MNGGTIEYNNESISNGTVGTYMNAIYNKGKMEINSGTVTSNTIAIAVEGGTVNINGGTIEGRGRTIDEYKGTININGGNIVSNVLSGYASSALEIYSVVNFYDGTINTIDDMHMGDNAVFNHYGGEIIKSSPIRGLFSGNGTYNDYREKRDITD